MLNFDMEVVQVKGQKYLWYSNLEKEHSIITIQDTIPAV